MKHLDEGALLALRDEADIPDEASAAAHLEECAACRTALEEARRTARRVSAALSALDEPFDVEAARGMVRAQVAEASAQQADAPSVVGRARDEARSKRSGEATARPPTRNWGRALGRAAGLVLLAAVGAYALPNSPVRNWVRGIGESGTEAVEAGRPSEGRASPESSGIRVTVAAPVRVEVLGLAPGEELTVLWVPGSEVAVFADSQSRFQSGSSLVQATVSGGPVRVELPADVRPLTLEVGGRIWLRNLPGGIETPVEPVEAEGRFLRFVAPDVGGR